MTPLPNYRPKQLSLGPLEAEILHIVWELGTATTKDVHERIMTDPERELTYSSVTTVLRRLSEKGWLACDKTKRSFAWRALISRQQAQAAQVEGEIDIRTRRLRAASHGDRQAFPELAAAVPLFGRILAAGVA